MLHNFILNGSLFGKAKKFEDGGGLGNFKIQLDSWICDVYEDSYEEGEGKNVNYFSEKENKVFNSPKEFFDYLHNKVFYKDLKNEHYNAFEDGRITTSFLVDEDNSAASESEIAAWKKGKKKLYSANYNIYVSLVDKKTPTVEELAKILDIPQYKQGGGVAKGWTDAEKSDLEAQYAGGGKLKQKGTSDKDHDKDYKAKRVGYRYSDKLAKKLGLSANAKPTEEHIEKYLHKGVYFEDRANRSDKSRMKKLEDGGEFSKDGGLKQKGTTDKKHDKDYKAKRVGYRYTDERAKKLGLSPNAKPTQEHIDKYLGNGVYFEDRANRSDKSRMKKLKRGGNAGNKTMMQKIQDEVKKLKAEAPNMFKKHTDFVKQAAANLKAKGQL